MELAVSVHDHVTLRTGRLANDREEAEAAVRAVVAWHEAGIAWHDILIVAPGKRKWRDRLGKALDAGRVPHRMLLGEPGRLPDPEHEGVHATSLYGAQGLTFVAVVVVGLGDLPWKQQPLDEAMRVFRAAAMVASAALTVSWSRPSALVDALSGG